MKEYQIVMPRLSDTMDEGQLVAWKIAPGDTVKKGDVVAEVESDKAVMEIESFKNGTVKALLVQTGETVRIGTPIALLDTQGEQRGAAGATEQHETKTKTKTPAPSPAIPAPETEKTPPKQDPLSWLLGGAEAQPSSYVGGTASPRAREAVERYGLDLEALQKEGSLPTPAHLADIKQYVLRRYFTPRALELIRRYQLSSDQFEIGKKHDADAVEAYIKAHDIPKPEPLDMLRKSMIAIVNEAVKKPVYHMSDRIETRWLKAYETETATVTVWLLKLFAEAMMRHEGFRATLTGQGMQVWPNASISLAMANGEYLYMPVFKSVNLLSLSKIAEQLQAYKTKIAQRRLSKEELAGSTFGISNLGMTGIEQFDAMINKNDSAIAAVGSERDGKIAITLTVDHRIVNGYQAAEFMQELKALASDEAFFKKVTQ